MKALTLRRPWPWAIFCEGKRIENRTWAPPPALLGQRLAIHAGQGNDQSGAEAILGAHGDRYDLREVERGALSKRFGMFATGIVGVVTVVGVATSPEQARARGFDVRWWRGPLGWLLAEPVALHKPIECQGRLGLWELTPGLERRLLAQIERSAA